MADPKAPEPVSSDDSCFIRFVGCPRSPVPLAEIRDKLHKFYRLHIVSEAEHVVAEKALAWLQSTPEELGKNEGMMVLALRRLEKERTP